VIFIEQEGALYRGSSRGLPREVWSHKTRTWQPYTGTVPKPIEWGNVIERSEAREMMGEDGAD
jgi:hypothetical protein